MVLTSKLSQLRQNEEKMEHIKCIVMVRPLRSNIDFIRTELKDPKYGEYYVYFSNLLHLDLLKQLAQADERERIKQVKEIYCDYYAVNSSVFTLNLRGSLALWKHTAPFTRAM